MHLYPVQVTLYNVLLSTVRVTLHKHCTHHRLCQAVGSCPSVTVPRVSPSITAAGCQLCWRLAAQWCAGCWLCSVPTAGCADPDWRLLSAGQPSSPGQLGPGNPPPSLPPTHTNSTTPLQQYCKNAHRRPSNNPTSTKPQSWQD